MIMEILFGKLKFLRPNIFFRYLSDKINQSDSDFGCSISRSYMHQKGLFEIIYGMKLHYLRVGHGEHNLLLLPAPIGSAVTDYSTFLNYLNQDKFTAIALDLPGQGASIPPMDRSWMQPNRLQEDAQISLELMYQLNLCPFSILAWSDTVWTALLMTSSYAKSGEIRKLILWAHEGSLPFASINNYYNSIQNYADINNWPMQCRAPLEAIYGLDYLQNIWSNYIKAKLHGSLLKQINFIQLKNELKIYSTKQTKPNILLMRTFGLDNMEDKLTYLLSIINHVQIINWLNLDSTNSDYLLIKQHKPCWGPHRIVPNKFQTYVEQFLSI